MFIIIIIIIIIRQWALIAWCDQDDNWRPVNYQNEESMVKFEQDMKQLGIDDIHSYTHGI